MNEVLQKNELLQIQNDLSKSVELYNLHRDEFISHFGLGRFEGAELAIKAIWSCYVAHNLKEYGNGPPTLNVDVILSAKTIMCSQYSTLAVNIMQEFNVPDNILRPIGWEDSPIGAHSELLFSYNQNNFLIDPTVGLIVLGVTDAGIMSGESYTNFIEFNKSNDLNWYTEKIQNYYSKGEYSVSNLTYLADGFEEWSNSLASAFAFHIDTQDNHFIFGSRQHDLLTGTSGFDVIYGRAGNDSLSSIGGGDQLYGGAGDDKYYVTSYTTIVSECIDNLNPKNAGGIDKIFSTVSYRLPNFFESITLTGDRNINAIGNDLNNSISGNKADNKIYSGLGRDTLCGGFGADTIDMGNDNEKDISRYLNTSDSNMSTLDRIVNFKSGVDKIDLSSIDANSNILGNQNFGFNASMANPNSVWIRDVGNNLYIHADATGDFVPEISICLIGVSSIIQSDVIL